MRTRAACVLMTVLALSTTCLLPASAATPRSGTIDSGFGTRGVVHLAPSTSAPARSTDPQAHVLAATGSRVWVGADQGHGSYVRPLTTTGRAVTTFNHGRPVVPVADAQVLGVRAVLPTADGGVLAVTQLADPSAVRVDRFTSSGARQSTWGTNHGFTYVTPSCVDCSIDLTGAVLLSDGRIRVMGTYTDNASSTRQALVVGLTPHGRLDTTVGPAGLRAVTGSPDGTTEAVTSDASDRLYFVVDDGGQPDLVRTTAAGALDLSYNTDGIAPTPLPDGRTLSQASHAAAPGARLATIVVSPKGETYVAVNTRTSTLPVRWQVVMFHVNPHGYRDQSFGPGHANGFPTFALTGGSGSISALQAAGGGRFLLALTYWDGRRFLHLLLQLTGIGDPDGHFGHHAAVPTSGYVSALTRLADRRMVATGWPTSGRVNSPRGRSVVTAYVD